MNRRVYELVGDLQFSETIEELKEALVDLTVIEKTIKSRAE